MFGIQIPLTQGHSKLVFSATHTLFSFPKPEKKKKNDIEAKQKRLLC